MAFRQYLSDVVTSGVKAVKWLDGWSIWSDRWIWFHFSTQTTIYNILIYSSFNLLYLICIIIHAVYSLRRRTSLLFLMLSLLHVLNSLFTQVPEISRLPLGDPHWAKVVMWALKFEKDTLIYLALHGFLSSPVHWNFVSFLQDKVLEVRCNGELFWATYNVPAVIKATT